MLLPVLALVHLALFVTMMAMLISLVNTGTILSWHLPDDVPLWAGVLILLAGYQIVVSPIRAANRVVAAFARRRAGTVVRVLERRRLDGRVGVRRVDRLGSRPRDPRVPSTTSGTGPGVCQRDARSLRAVTHTERTRAWQLPSLPGVGVLHSIVWWRGERPLTTLVDCFSDM